MVLPIVPEAHALVNQRHCRQCRNSYSRQRYRNLPTNFEPHAFLTAWHCRDCWNTYFVKKMDQRVKEGKALPWNPNPEWKQELDPVESERIWKSSDNQKRIHDLEARGVEPEWIFSDGYRPQLRTDQVYTESGFFDIQRTVYLHLKDRGFSKFPSILFWNFCRVKCKRWSDDAPSDTAGYSQSYEMRNLGALI